MTPFGPPRAVTRLLEGLEVPWFVAGGWAIDLFLGRETRDHDDIEVAIFRADQKAVRSHLSGWEFSKGVAGKREPWREGERLELPLHEIHARGPRDPGEIEILLNESDGTLWRFRRDLRVTRSISEVGGKSHDGIPYLAPEIVLLYKAKAPRERDEADFRNVRDRMQAQARDWLRSALEVVLPGHPWIAPL